MKWGSERVLAVARSSVRAAWRLGGLVRVAFGPSEDERLGTCWCNVCKSSLIPPHSTGQKADRDPTPGARCGRECE